MEDFVLRHAENDDDLRACFPVMRQLRPHLLDEADFSQRLRRMASQHYHLLAVWKGSTPLALAGYRLQENLIYGRFLYVDDLVSAAGHRGRQFGARLLAELRQVAARENCEKLVLDTGLSNALAQRFYFRQGLLTEAVRFASTLAKDNE